MSIDRRCFVKAVCAVPLLFFLPGIGNAGEMTGVEQLKAGYKKRLKKLLAGGKLPYIDVESSCRSSMVDIDALAASMDRLDIGLMALSADIGKKQFKNGVLFDRLSQRLVASYPDRFIPVGNGGQPPALTKDPDAFLAAQEAAALQKRILFFGEYELRHYPSPRQFERGEMDRDVHIPVDGPVGHRLFSLSERTGLPFQIHYEIEDGLLAPLEKMLAQYPRAKVIWCHLAQIRYIERASQYTPEYVEGLIKRYPNLYFDTAFGGMKSVYPPSKQRHARVWNVRGGLKSDWRDLIVSHPTRFLSALDLGQDRLDQIDKYDKNHRKFLKQLPVDTQHHVAYRNAWSLLFGETFA